MLRSLRVLPVKEVPLDQAAHHFAAVPIVSPHDHPLFDNSAVDGYAFKFDHDRKSYRIAGAVAAGETLKDPIRNDECARIFTGAMMPDGADTVIMQEFVEANKRSIELKDPKLRKGANVRKKAEQIKAGTNVIGTGGSLSPAAIGLLASVGVRKVQVHEWPYVTVIVTGNEFTEDEPCQGRIFSSNDHMLGAALERVGIKPRIVRVKDERQTMSEALRQAVSQSDLVITTGGVSVGDHDLVAPVLQEIGATIVFHKVAQKPGKPMLFATHGNTAIIGLPGNPRAVMILFWEYVLPAIRAMMGAKEPFLRSDILPLSAPVTFKGERCEFRAAKVKNGKVELLRDEGSHMLASLLQADALAFFPADVREVKAGEPVEIHYIPNT